MHIIKFFPCIIFRISVQKKSPRYNTLLGKDELGERALRNPAFIAELTRLINQGYWFFDE